MDEQQIFAAPYRLNWGGKELRFGQITGDVMAHFTALCKSAALIGHTELMGLKYPPPLTQESASAKREDEEAFREDMVSGLFAWGGTLAEKWRTKTEPGSRAFIRCLLEEGGTPLNDAELAQLLSEKREAVAAVIVAVLWDSANPKAKRPAALTALLTAALSTPPISMPGSSATPSTADAA